MQKELIEQKAEKLEQELDKIKSEGISKAKHDQLNELLSMKDKELIERSG